MYEYLYHFIEPDLTKPLGEGNKTEVTVFAKSEAAARRRADEVYTRGVDYIIKLISIKENSDFLGARKTGL